LADEPTANVDVKNQDLILDLIREACAESKVALLMVTHSPEVASRFPRVDRLENFNRAALTTGAAR
jgi:putative ABC transport system ATP-binding protein